MQDEEDRKKPIFVVQDHERCLWTAKPLKAMKAINVNILENCPKSWQDLNPIEIVWRELKTRLDVTLPASLESRAEFISRFGGATAWVNTNRTNYLYELCTCQERWARDVKNATPRGSPTAH